MNKSSFQEIKALLGQSDTGTAIQKLSELLADSGKHSAYQQILKVIEGHYHAMRSKELKGIVTFSEAQRDYNQINDSILQMISDIESGKTTPSELVQSRSYKRIIIGGLLLVLAAITAWLVLGREPEQQCRRAWQHHGPVPSGVWPRHPELPERCHGRHRGAHQRRQPHQAHRGVRTTRARRPALRGSPVEQEAEQLARLC